MVRQFAFEYVGVEVCIAHPGVKNRFPDMYMGTIDFQGRCCQSPQWFQSRACGSSATWPQTLHELDCSFIFCLDFQLAGAFLTR